MESKETTTDDPSADPLAMVDQGVLEYEPDSTSIKQEAVDEDSGEGSDVSLPRVDLEFDANLVHSTRDVVPCELWMPGLDSDDPLSEERVSSYIEPLEEGNDPLVNTELAAEREQIESSSASTSRIHLSEISQEQHWLYERMLLNGGGLSTPSTTDPDDTVVKSVVAKSGNVGGSSPSAAKENSTINVDVHPPEDLAMFKTNSPIKRHLEEGSFRNESALYTSGTRNLMDTLIESVWNDRDAGPSSITAANHKFLTAVLSSETKSAYQTSSTSTDLQDCQYEGLGEKITPLLKVRSDLHDPVSESLPDQTPTTSTDLPNSQYGRLNEKTVTPLLKVQSDLIDLTQECTESTDPNIHASFTSSLSFHNLKKCTRSKACQVNSFNPETEFLKNLFALSKAPSARPLIACYDINLDCYSKSIIYNVVEYFRKKKKKFALKYLVKDVACDATGLPRSTVESVMRTAHKSLKDNLTLEYPRFQEYLTALCMHCGEVLVDFAIRQIICNGYIQEGKAFTFKEIYKRLVAEEELPVCKDFLRRRIRDLGFDLMRSVAAPRYIPLERPELAAWRYHYFQEIQKYRIMQRQIVYMFEADIFKLPDTKGIWRPIEGHPTSSGTNMVTVIYAAKESGFIDGSLLCHGGAFREHRQWVGSFSQYWLTVHLPKLPLGSVIVLGHSRHHFMKPAKPKPDPGWPRQDIVNWLREHKEFSFSSTLPSAVLLEKVQAVDVGSKFVIDDVIISHGHIPLHLPPNHRELNPVELVWSKIVAKFPSACITSNAFMRLFLMKEFHEIAPSELQEAFELARLHENTHRQMDMRIDEPVAEVIRQVGGVLDRDFALELDEISEEDTSDVVFETSLEQSIAKSSHVRDLTSRENVSLSYQPRKKRKTSVTSAANPKNRQNLQARPEWNHSQVTSTQETLGYCNRDRNREDHPEWVISSSCSLIGPTEPGIHQRPSTSGSAPPVPELSGSDREYQRANVCDITLNSPFRDTGGQCFMEPRLQNLTSPAQQTASTAGLIHPSLDHEHQRKDTSTSVEVINLDDSDEETLSDPGLIENLAAAAPETSALYCPTQTSETQSLSASSSTIPRSPSETTGFLRNLIKSKFEILKKKM